VPEAPVDLGPAGQRNFTTYHSLLTDKFTASTAKDSDLDRWMPGGKKYFDQDSREWTADHNFPISQTKNTLLSLIAEFEAGPPDADAEAGLVTATSDLWTFTGKATFVPTNSAKTDTVKVPLKTKRDLGRWDSSMTDDGSETTSVAIRSWRGETARSSQKLVGRRHLN
jgi:hypothetical protein